MSKNNILKCGDIMRDEYDLSGGIKNPYVKKLKQQITIDLDNSVIAYFKTMSENVGIVRLSPFTRSQVNHRYHALRRGYFFMEDCSEGSGERYNIYYDGETARSPRFETNLEKDGFRIMEWKKTEDYEYSGEES